jgi:glycosyltransferase involved in cell wall biosynthesis
LAAWVGPGADGRMSRVSVLIPNYNGGTYLAECLRSVMEQTSSDWEAVVGDNASTDESVSIVSAASDRRLRLVRRPANVGWVANVNLLLHEAGGDYIAILHADDFWEPSFLARMVEMLDRSPGSLLATSGSRVVTDGRPTAIRGLHEAWRGPATTCPSTTATRLLTMKNWLRAPSVVMRRTLFRHHPTFDESLPLVNDWLMWLRAATIGNIEVCPEALANYRFHDSSTSAESIRGNRWGGEMIRMARIVQADWAHVEPFPGARRAIAAGVGAEILADAGLRAERGDSAGAIIQARRARALAPGPKQLALAVVGEQVIRLTSVPGLRQARRPAAEIGRWLWGILRPAA